MNEELKKAIYEAVNEVYPQANIRIEDVELIKPVDSLYGDLTCNIALKVGAKLKLNPNEVAVNIYPKVWEKKPSEIKSVGHFPNVFGFRFKEVKSGFINMEKDEEYVQKDLKEIISKGKKYADLDAGKGQKVQVEFISANPTGPLTLANGRGGFSGDVLANVFKKSGYSVEREYYVNDGGSQVEIYMNTMRAIAMDPYKIGDSTELMYQGWLMTELAKEIRKEIEKEGDVRDLTIKDWDKKVREKEPINRILENIKESVSKMNIQFDNWFSEKAMVEKGEVDGAIKSLKKLTYEKDNALWLKTTEFGDDKDRVLVKKDGEKTYFANDIAYHFDKFAKRKFDKVVDLWGADHHGYVARMQAATEAMGFGGKLDIIIFQMVRLIKDGKEYRMSKRKGNYVTMDDLLDEIGAKDAADVARFFFVSRDFDTHMDFDLDLAKDTSEKNPVYYVKYAYARINGILRNTKVDFSKPDLSLITEPAEIDLIKKISELPEIVESVISDKKYPVHKFTYYISEIAEKFH
ncbi:MAG: arginine--tRNA ligase, partial [Patescibacteria group bacterium]